MNGILTSRLSRSTIPRILDTPRQFRFKEIKIKKADYKNRRPSRTREMTSRASASRPTVRSGQDKLLFNFIWPLYSSAVSLPSSQIRPSNAASKGQRRLCLHFVLFTATLSICILSTLAIMEFVDLEMHGGRCHG